MKQNSVSLVPKSHFKLDGTNLTTSKAVELGRQDSHILMSEEACINVMEGRKVVEKILEEGKPFYGINTAFGALAGVPISPEDLNKLQYNLIVSHQRVAALRCHCIRRG